MSAHWLLTFQQQLRDRWTRLVGRGSDQGPSLSDRLADLERAISRMAREQAKANLGLEAVGQTQGQMATELDQGLRRLEEALRRRQQIDEALIETGRRQGRDQALKQAVGGLISVLDGLHQAIAAARSAQADPAWAGGLETVRCRGEAVLAEWDIGPTSAPGMSFDPEVHEAVGVVDGPADSGPIIQHEVLRGYRRGEQILRIAKVVVVRGGQDSGNRPGDDQFGGGGDRGGWQAPDS